MNIKKIYWILALGGVLTGAPLHAQTIEAVLRSVEQNNKELQAGQYAAEAGKMEVQTQNNLEDPSVEYSPFYADGVTGMASSELVVKQGFEFPTRYVARRSSGKLQQEVIDRQHRLLRQDVLLRAKNLCLDLIGLNQERLLLEERRKNADELLVLFEKRLSEGDASALEVNKIKMERMNVQTEAAQNAAAHRTALQQLLAMNGNQPLEFDETSYPNVPPVADYNTLYDEVIASDVALQTADAQVRAAEKEVSVNKQNWLPSIEVGYRRNTSMGEKSNGFLIGGSLPLFSNRKKLKIARAQASSARMQLDNTRLHEAMQAYDIRLMHQTLRMLRDAVEAGQLSIIEFYVEAENVYQNLQAYNKLENQYQKLMAEIYKNRL